MKYIDAVNGAIKDVLKARPDTVAFGQNIDAGSCLMGLTRGLSEATGATIINTPNCENSLVGFGFGMMMGGGNAVYFMKQLDFLLLGIDHLVNTFNVIRLNPPVGSFTIVPIIVDNGFQGLQSSFNSFGDLCSVARIQGYTVVSGPDIDLVLRARLVAPGFRIIAVSQRLFARDVYRPECVAAVGPDSVFSLGGVAEGLQHPRFATGNPSSFFPRVTSALPAMKDPPSRDSGVRRFRAPARH